MPMTVTVVKIWTIEADQLPVHYPTSTSTRIELGGVYLLKTVYEIDFE